MRRAGSLLMALGVLVVFSGAANAQSDFQSFETGQTRPVALSPDGAQLFVCNTPDNQLEIYDVDGGGLLSHAASVQVGLEPTAVAARTNDEVWVVNHLSDSVSIVKLTPQPHVERTLLLGDEPQDIVFAGAGGNRAFITTAHRGQHLDWRLSKAGDAVCEELGDNTCDSQQGGRLLDFFCSCSEQTAEGTGRADVWVFDATGLGSDMGGTPLSIVNLFGDKPRALSVSPDGSKVYAAVFHSGNQTTSINEGFVCDGVSGALAAGSCPEGPGGYPPPHDNNGPMTSQTRPETGLIVQFNRDGGSSNQWQDEGVRLCAGGPDDGDPCASNSDCGGGGTCGPNTPRNWNGQVNFDLPDLDVFEINANATPPVAVDGSESCTTGSGCWAGVGSVLFNMAVNPVSGKVYVSNSDAENQVRFEGPGTHAAGFKPPGEPATVQGHLAEMRITVLDGSNVDARHLNKHIDYSMLPAPGGVNGNSLSTPTGMAVTPDGSTLYVAAFGSGKIGIFDTTALENDSFTPSVGNHIHLSGGGPSGLTLDGNRLYVLTRFDNTIRVVDRLGKIELQSLALHNPEPLDVVDGRPLLYDALLTSSNGEASCASCHIFGDMDDLAWDLGNPDDDVVPNGNDFNPVIGSGGLPEEYHPTKGPMTTQSLRGLANMGPQHWRGDRQGDETAAFEAFSVAFAGLLGRATEGTGPEMVAFRKFALLLRYPPNPLRKLDNSMRPDESSGLGQFDGPITDTVSDCEGCHVLNEANGHFGGDGQLTFDAEPQHFKVPHLRNAYQKVGMFGLPDTGGLTDGPFTPTGPQVRGYGFTHDGSLDTLFRFVSASVFSVNATQQAQLERFLLAFPSDLAPIVGQQLTLHLGNSGATQVEKRIDLLIDRARAGFTSQVLGGAVKECDLIAKVVEDLGVGGTRQHGYLYDPGSDLFLPDDGGAGIADAALRGKALVAGQEVTYTCVPPGAGIRMAHDRDRDTLLDGVETNSGSFVAASDTGTDPALADTDGDGFDDGDEVNLYGTDPTDPLDFPGASSGPAVPALSPLGTGVLLGALLLAGRLGLRRRR